MSYRSRSRSRDPHRDRGRHSRSIHDSEHRRERDDRQEHDHRHSRRRSRSPTRASSPRRHRSREGYRSRSRDRRSSPMRPSSPKRAAAAGHHSHRDHRSPDRGRAPPPLPMHNTDPPALFSVHQAAVHTIKPFGLFCAIPGYRKHVLVHHTSIHEQIRFSKEDADEDKVKGMEFFFPKGQPVWLKVTEVGQGDGAKLCGSMLVVDQETGQDLDPDNKMVRGPGGGGGGGPLSDGAPEVGSVHKGTVKRIEPYGVFVAMAGYRKWGMVHSSQVSTYLSFNKEDTDADKKAELTGVVNIGDMVWVKVVEVGEDERGPKIQCSIKLVDQTTGEDLDPVNSRYKPRGTGERGRGGMAPIGSEAGEIIGGTINWGHLAGDAKLHAGDHEGRYKLLGAAPEEQAGPARLPPPPPNYELKQQGLPPGDMLLPPPPPFLPPPPPRQILTVEDALAVLEQDAKNKKHKKHKKKSKSKKDKSSKSKDKKSSKHKSKSSKRKHASDSSSSGSESSDSG